METKGTKRGDGGKALLPSLFNAEFPLSDLQIDINRVFDDFWTSFHRPFRAPVAEHSFVQPIPNINVAETEKEIEVTAELPGLEEKDVEVTLADNVLTIKGERKSESEEKGKNYLISERRFGGFQRHLPMHVEIDEGKVEAVFKNGVLAVTLPKSKAARTKTKQIKVKAA